MPRLALCSICWATLVLGTGRHNQEPIDQGRAVVADSIVDGIFEGRTPCGRVALHFTGFPSDRCDKIKWELTLFRDAVTQDPHSFRYRGTRTARSGTWSLKRGSAMDPKATVYELKYEGGSLYLLAADTNVLLLLDEDRRLLVGDASWSYTLNRTDGRGR